jgi:SAM-dependent methyltransferase
VTSSRQWYERSGFASLDDLQSSHWKEVFEELEHVQSDFLSCESQFRSPAYKWPRDALHFVARPWEYAYVLSNLKGWQESRLGIDQLKVMDFGSGVTFFPFAVGKLGMEVTAVDIDPVVQNDLVKASQVISASPGSVKFALSRQDNTIPVADSSFDCIYSISVLEHIEDRIAAARELMRVLRLHAILILTFDVCFQGEADIRSAAYKELTGYLRDNMELVWPEISIHPSRTLSCYNGPYPYRDRSMLSHGLQGMLKNCARRIMGRPILPLDRVFMGMVLRKT